MTTLEIVEYYAALLIKQYAELPNAEATIEAFVAGAVMPQASVQQVELSDTPTSGAFTLVYSGLSTAAINWNDSDSTAQTKIRAISGLGSITVAATPAGFAVNFVGVAAPASLFVVGTNTLLRNTTPVTIGIEESDLTLPLAVQNGFNLNGTDTAVGVQLDILGKYVGVTRSGTSLTGNFITLGDADFLTLIRMAIAQNNLKSDLQTIQNFLQLFFGGQILVTDYQNMRLAYTIASSIGSTDLIQLMLSERLLPHPMGVGVSAAVVPLITNLFSFRTYQSPRISPSGRPFNTYANWDLTWRWLSYADII